MCAHAGVIAVRGLRTFRQSGCTATRALGPGVVGDVVAVGRPRGGLQKRREVHSIDAECPQVADGRGSIPQREVGGQLQPIGAARLHR